MNLLSNNEEIIFKTLNIITVPSGNNTNNALAATALRNLEDYGFTFTKEAYDLLSTASREEIIDWYTKTAQKLNELAGGNHIYKPFYPNFPEQVMDASELELFVDQFLHYITAQNEFVDQGYMRAEGNYKEGVKSLESHNLRVLDVINAQDTEQIKSLAKKAFTDLLKSKTNLSNVNLNVVNSYIACNPTWNLDVKDCENRNNLSYLYTLGITEQKDVSGFPKLVTNDYLRIAKITSYMKKNNTSFLENIDDIEKQEIKSIPNSMRKFIISSLENLKNAEEDIARNKTQWKVLFKIMHVGEPKFQKYKKVNELADKLRNNGRFITFYSKVEEAFANRDIKKVIHLYEGRPGEFIKNFGRIVNAIETDSDKELFLNVCQKVFDKTRPEDLITFLEYAKTRGLQVTVHNVKGKFWQDDKEKVPFSEPFIQIIEEFVKDSLKKQLYTGVPYGKVYISPELAYIPAPKDVKDSSDTMSTYPKGSALSIEKNEDNATKNIRCFVWWTNQPQTDTQPNRVDIDLSFNLFKKCNDNKGHTFLEPAGRIGWNASYKDGACVYSGDITNGGPVDGDGVTEYIDINMKILKEMGIDYAQMHVHCFTGQSFSSLTNCEFGWMERDELDKTQQFDIKAVKQHGKLSAERIDEVCCMIDVNNERIIWIDSPDMSSRKLDYSSGAQALDSVDLLMARYANGKRITLEELAKISVEANGGEFVATPEEADVLFVVDEYEGKTESQRMITSKMQSTWLGEFMAPQKVIEPENKDVVKEASDIESTLNQVEKNNKTSSRRKHVEDIER